MTTVQPQPHALAGAPAAPGNLFRGQSAISAQAGNVTGVSTTRVGDYEAYYGPAPPGVSNADVMGQVARTNLQLPAYYQGKNLYLERIISWGVADLDDCTQCRLPCPLPCLLPCPLQWRP